MQNYNFKIIRIISVYLYISIAILFSTFYFLLSGFAFASETSGTITSGGNNGYAWSDQTGWVNFGATNGNINITDSGITGNAWSINYGWINMSPTNGRVTVAVNGALSGYAWGSGLGWINFSGVFINSSGKFTGQASGTTVGALTFDCVNCSVITDYRPQNFRTTTPSSGGGGGGGLLINTNPPIAPNGGFKAVINNDELSTDNRIVVLTLKGGSDTARMAVSNFSDFKDAIQENYSTTKVWTLTEGEGVKTVYAKFYTQYGYASGIIFDTIEFGAVKPSEISAPVVGAPGEATGKAIEELPIAAEQTLPVLPPEEIASIPKQLFDINLEIDNTPIEQSQDLSARVIFTSFGKEPTPVDLTFDILDVDGNVVHTEKEQTIVETEKVLSKKFEDLNIDNGKYVLRLTTLYNIDVRDEFSQNFEIAASKAPGRFYWPYILAVILIAALAIFIILFIKRIKGNNDSPQF